MKDNLLSLAVTYLADGVTWLVDENLTADDIGVLHLPTGLQAVTNRSDLNKALGLKKTQVNFSDFNLDEMAASSKVVYRISKEKLLAHHCINQSLRNLKRGGELILLGGKQDGIKSIVKNLDKIYGSKTRIKKHGTSYVATCTLEDSLYQRLHAQPDFPGLPDDSYTKLRKVSHRGVSFHSKPGVFGWNKVDRGSELLVSKLPEICKYQKQQNDVLDLGCGWGYLMLATADMPFQRRIATDNNIAAVSTAAYNFKEAGMAVECVADDCASQISGRFDLILCNPPFHQGFSVSDSMTEKFVAAAARLCRRDTRVGFVVNQFIPLPKVAEKYFPTCRELLAADGFKVFLLSPASPR